MAGKRTHETNEQIRDRVSMAVAVDPELEGTDLRVFLYLIARLEADGFFRVPQLEMAMAMGKRKEHISRAIRRLTEAGVIAAGPKGNRASEWQLNPDFGS
jgi:DNA-directed RNA polymerase specialized sigma54-like protein